MEERLLTKKQVCEMCAYSRQHLARMVNDKKFPAPLKPHGIRGRALWLLSEIQAYIEQLKAKRDSARK